MSLLFLLYLCFALFRFQDLECYRVGFPAGFDSNEWQRQVSRPCICRRYEKPCHLAWQYLTTLGEWSWWSWWSWPIGCMYGIYANIGGMVYWWWMLPYIAYMDPMGDGYGHATLLRAWLCWHDFLKLWWASSCWFLRIPGDQPPIISVCE